ncbi:MAG: BrnT family toxin [Microcystaceae cyanobacterium]
MNFEWDDPKNLSNIDKHGISFEEVKSIFTDSQAIITEDSRYEYGEI